MRSWGLVRFGAEARKARFLMLLVCSVVLAGCVSAPVRIVVTDRETGAPIEGASVMARPLAYISLTPTAEGITDADGAVTLQLKRSHDRGPYIRINRYGNTSQANYTSLLYTSGGFIEEASAHYKETGRPAELRVPVTKIPRLPSCDVLIELPDGYEGLVGISLRQRKNTHTGFIGTVEVRVFENGESVVYSTTEIDEPCVDRQLRLYRFASGQQITRWRPQDSETDGVFVFHLQSRGGNGYIELEPGVMQQIYLGGDLQTVDFVGSHEQIDEYKERIGHSHRAKSAEFVRMFGPL